MQSDSENSDSDGSLIFNDSSDSDYEGDITSNDDVPEQIFDDDELEEQNKKEKEQQKEIEEVMERKQNEIEEHDEKKQKEIKEVMEKIKVDEKLIKDITIAENKLENEFPQKPVKIESLITDLKEQQKELQESLESEKQTLETLIKTPEKQETERIEYKPEEINEDAILNFKQSILIVIDPSEQLCSQEALDHLETFLKKQKTNKTLTKITNIWIAKHAHTKGIDTQIFWKNFDGNMIDVDDILAKKIVPVDTKYQNYVIAYTKQLRDFGRTGICLRDEKERLIDPRLELILKDTGIPIDIFVYGQNMFTETISIFESIIPIKNDKKTFGDEEALNKLKGYDKIILCGDQLAVHLTARTLATKDFSGDKIVILEDMLCTNPCFHGFPNLHIIQSSELN